MSFSGVRFATGYSPWAFPSGPYRGFSFGETDVKLGYAMGRLTPYVVAGAALARPSYGADFGDLSQSVNGLFSGPGAVQAVGTAGVGFDYAVTNNLTVGLEARVSNGGPFVAPRPLALTGAPRRRAVLPRLAGRVTSWRPF